MNDVSGSISRREISGVLGCQPLAGSLSTPSPGRKEIVSATTEEWNSKPTRVSVKDIVYVYTDYKVVNGKNVPGLKIGDGTTYLIDLPFISGGCEVTQEQIDFWNDKCSAMIDPEDPEHLILYTDQR